MASSEPYMSEPEIFISFTDDEEQPYRVNSDISKILKQIKKEMVIVGVVGPSRTGKSAFMNWIAFEEHGGFEIGNSSEAVTKGIWIWIINHPQRKDSVLVLLDTEGLSHAHDGDRSNDVKLFTLVTLLSSHLIYNSRGNIDSDSLDKISLVSNMADHLQSKPCDESWEQTTTYFPDFTWIIRDFTLNLKIEDKACTSDEFLEFILKNKPGTSKKIYDYNWQREAFKETFQRRRCFVLPMPTDNKNIKYIKSMKLEELDEEFVEGVEKIRTFVLKKSKPKSFHDGQIWMDGWTLNQFAEIYVSSINEGVIPDMKSVADSAIYNQNRESLTTSLKFYKDEMMKRITDVPLTTEDLARCHNALSSQASELFSDERIYSKEHDFREELIEGINEIFKEIEELNDKTSENICRECLEKLRVKFDELVNFSDNYSPGIYQECLQERFIIESKYWSIANKGDQAAKIFVNFCEETDMKLLSIMSIDDKLSEGQRILEEEKLKRVKEEKRQEYLEKRARMLEEAVRTNEATTQEIIRQQERDAQKNEERIEGHYRRLIDEKISALKEAYDQAMSVKVEKLVCIIHNLEQKLKNREEAAEIRRNVVGMTGLIGETFLSLLRD